MSGILAGLVLTSTLAMPAHGDCSASDDSPLEPCAASLFRALADETARCDHLTIDLTGCREDVDAERASHETTLRDLFASDERLRDAQAADDGIPGIFVAIGMTGAFCLGAVTAVLVVGGFTR